MTEIKNGTIFIIENELWLYIRYSSKIHILTSLEKVEPTYFPLGKFWAVQTVDKYLNNEQMEKVLKNNPDWKNNKIWKKEQGKE